LTSMFSVRLRFLPILGGCAWIAFAIGACDHSRTPEAQSPATIEVGAGPDLFREMDCGLDLAPDEIKGRNAWHLWTAGNDAFWDEMARQSSGLVDLLKTLDSRKRESRFKELGLINEPGYRQAKAADRFGLWLDEPINAASPGVDPQIYGRSTGVLGFRLFPNPAFTSEAFTQWNADSFYNDPKYAADPALVRPYRIGVSCSACHVGPNPLNPPQDPANPEWKNLASVIGNQYLHEGRVFAPGAKPGSFFWEILRAQPRGTSDTSRLATDNINNPNAINPIFLLNERLRIGHEEVLSGETLLLAGTQPRMKVPRVLKDGADSVGFTGAALRVFVNTGLFYQHWLEQHQLLYGLTEQKPFSIRRAQAESVQWRATEAMLPNLARFFARLEPMHLADAPGGKAYLTPDPAVLYQGRTIFALHCAGCHSSRQPPLDAERQTWFLAQSSDPEFWEGNFLSNEERYPVAEIGTNAGRASATNATRNHVWNWFSSETYKTQPASSPIQVWNPYTKRDETFSFPADGRGYYRTPSLISIWATAPFLHNNSIGEFNGDPSVKGRIEAFNDAIEKLLWPEKRLGRQSIWRTSAKSDLEIPGHLIPETIRNLLGKEIDNDGIFRLGPIPRDTPINLLANIDPRGDPAQLAELAIKIRSVLAQVHNEQLDPEATRLLMKRELAPMLFKLSKCPDLVEDRGHPFGTTLPDDDKLALIEFLKTL
jgi:mono/diheme cytochrome c family protein